MYEKIKFSNIRNIYLYINYLYVKLLNLLRLRNDLWMINSNISRVENLNHRILIFCPSLSLDKPSYLNVGIKAFINTAKYKNIDIDLIKCENSLNICHLGGSPFTSNNKMPCLSCIKVNKSLYKDVNQIKLENIKNYNQSLNGLNVEKLKNYKYKGFDIGKMVTSSVIWIKRTPTLKETDSEYFKKLISDGIKLIDYFEKLNLDLYTGVIVFNGASFPESILYDICKKQDINVATFEGGLSYNNKYSIEFNYGITAQHRFNFDKNIKIPESKLNSSLNLMKTQWVEGENVKENYFSNEANLDLSDKKIISIFGNVSWDTSQFISNTIFTSIFDWLESLKEVIKEFPDYTFIFRAHPGENRKLKQTFYGVGNWLKDNLSSDLKNVLIIDSDNKLNSYEIIKSSNIVLVYNSTIGIESTMLGKKSYAAASTHYSNQPFINSFKTKKEYINSLKHDIKHQNFELDNELIKLSKNYYYQLFNNVSYSLDQLIVKNDKKGIEANKKLINNKRYLLNSKFNLLVDNFINQKNIQSVI